MKTETKPAKGCIANGFTWISSDGRLTQVAWSDLKERGEALYVHDGTRWRRLRDVRDAAKYGDSVRVAIAPLDADASSIERVERIVRPSLLTGTGVEKVYRLRELAALPPTLVQASNAWASLDEQSRHALKKLWDLDNAEFSDAQIMDMLRIAPGNRMYRSPREETAHLEARRLQTAITAAGFRTGLHIDEALSMLKCGEILPEGVTPLDFSRFLLLRLSQPHTHRQEAVFLAQFAGSNDPIRDALNALYAMQSTDKEEALATAALVSSCALTARDSLAIVRELGLVGAPGDKLNLIAAGLVRSGKEEAQKTAEEIAALFDTDPTAAMETYGTVDMILTRLFPCRNPQERRQIAEQLQLGAHRPYDAQARSIIAALDTKTLDGIRSLMREGEANEPESLESLQLVLRAAATFGDQAPLWLRSVATSRQIEEAKMLARLPDVDTANRRIEQLTRAIEAPQPSREEVLAAARLAGFYSGLREAPEGAEIGAVMRRLEGVDLVAVLPNATAANNRVAEIRKRLASPDLPSEERVRLESAEVWLTAYSRALKRSASSGESSTSPLESSEVTALLESVRNDESLLVLFAPYAKVAAKQADVCARTAAGSGTDVWSVACESERALWGTDALAAALRAGSIVPEDREARSAAQMSELDLWKKYSIAFLDGDRDTMLKTSNTLRPEKSDSKNMVSVHDALFWLPANLSDATAPDGTRLGEWLLAEGRGAGALQGANGRTSLQLVAESWSLFGGKDVRIGDVVRSRVSVDYGGHSDPASTFFATSKVSAQSAEVSITHLHYSREMPSILPVGKVFTTSDKQETGDTSSGYRGYFLPRDDPRGTQLGVLTDCCQHPAGAGASCSIAGQSHPASGFFVVEDLEGNVVAQSWVWAASGETNGQASTGVIFDNIEARIGGSVERARAVRAVYDSAADELSTRFDRVLVGAGGNDIAVQDLPLTSEKLSLAAIGYNGYTGDSVTQRVWREGRSETDLKVSVKPNGFSVSQGDSSFSYTAASIQHEARRIEAEVASLPEDDVSHAPLRERLTVLRRMEGETRSWGTGLFVEDGPDRPVVDVRGPTGRELAMKELAKTVSGTFVFRDESGKEEIVEIKSEPVALGQRVEYETLPTSYGDNSKLSALLVNAGMPENEAVRYLEAFPGDVRSANTAWRNGWPAEVAAALAVDRPTIFWAGAQPCPKEILAIADADERIRATYQYTQIDAYARDPYAATAALASPDVGPRNEFMAALTYVASRSAQDSHSTNFSGDRLWCGISANIRATAATLPADPERDQIVSEGVRLLGLTQPSPWKTGDVEETVEAAMQLAAADILVSRGIGKEQTLVGATLENTQRSLALRPEGLPRRELHHDAALTSRDRFPVEILLTTQYHPPHPSRNAPESVSQRLAFVENLASRGLSPGEAALLVMRPVRTPRSLQSASQAVRAAESATSRYARAVAAAPEGALAAAGELTLAAAVDKVVEHIPTLRENFYEQDRLSEVLQMCVSELMTGEDIVRLSQVSITEHRSARSLDRGSTVRGLQFRQMVGAGVTLPEESREDHQLRQEKLVPVLLEYQKATKYVHLPPEVPVADVVEIAPIIDRARETCAAAGMQPTLGENMPDFYFERLDSVRAIGMYSTGKEALASRIAPNLSLTMTDLAQTAPILDELVTLLPPLPEWVRPTLRDVANAQTSGCSVEEIAEIVQIEPVEPVTWLPGTDDNWSVESSTRHLRAVLLASKTMRTARQEGVSREVLETVASLVVGRDHKGVPPLTEGNEKDLHWLLDLAAAEPAALERIREHRRDGSTQYEGSAKELVHHLAAEFGRVPAALGGVLPPPERKRYVSVV